MNEAVTTFCADFPATEAVFFATLPNLTAEDIINESLTWQTVADCLQWIYDLRNHIANFGNEYKLIHATELSWHYALTDRKRQLGLME